MAQCRCWPAEERIWQLSSAARWIADAKIETPDRRRFGGTGRRSAGGSAARRGRARRSVGAQPADRSGGSRCGADSAATAIDAEIKRLKRGTSLIDYQRVPAFARDLSALCAAIEGPLADADPAMALERMFDFIDLAPRLIERSDDSDGHIGTPFVRRARRPPCWRLGQPRRCPPNAPPSARIRPILRRLRRRRWDHRGFRASAGRTDTHSTLLLDRSRACALAVPCRPGFGNRALKRVEADQCIG